MKKITIIITGLVLVILLSLIDLGLNLLSSIPYLGSVLESLSEIVIETIQVIIVSIMAVVGLKES